MNLTDYEHLVEDLFVASSVEGAIAYLATHNGHALLVSGATGLLPGLVAGDYRSNYVVDVSRVASMNRIVLEDGYLLVGGSVTFRRLGDCEIVSQVAPLLHEAGVYMGDDQVRRRATLGGNVASAVGNADGAVVLMALEAEVEIANLTGAQWLTVGSLFVKRGVLRIDDATEIITNIRVPVWQSGQGAALERMVIPGDERPTLLLAVVLSVAPDESLEWLSVVAGGLSGIPVALRDLERDMIGQPLCVTATQDAFSRAVQEAVETLGLLGDSAGGILDQTIVAMAERAFTRACGMARASSPNLENHGPSR